MEINLTRLKDGQTGTVAGFDGGEAFIKKMQAMGLTTGKKVHKVSSHFWQGPQTIRVGKTRLAIGYRMAERIIVKVDKNEDK